VRVLIVTRLFPNARDPTFASFNRQQFAALGRRCEVEVLATIPWFPGAALFSRWTAAGRLVDVPRAESIAGLRVSHPRYLHLPRIGRGAADLLYAGSLAREIRRRRGRFDVLLGSWAFPDGAAAVALGRRLGAPVVVKVHGSDVNLFSSLPGVARRLRRTLPRADRVVAVSRPLAELVRSLGVEPGRIDLVANGVDPAVFHPRDRAAARAALGHPGDPRRWLVYVGRLQEDKGVLDLLEAFAALARRRSDVRLVLVGSGAARAACEQAAAALGERVVLAGTRPLDEVAQWMAASDAVVLPSWAEGTPNVVLEALACGRRVVATRVGGTPDVLTGPELGELVPPRAPAALADALDRGADARYSPGDVARAGARHDWDESARRLEASLRRATG